MKFLKIEEDKLLIARDYVLDEFYSGDYPTQIDEFVLLQKIKKNDLNKFMVLCPFKKAWITYKPSVKKSKRTYLKIIFDKKFMKHVFDFLEIEIDSFFFEKFTIKQFAKNQQSYNKIRGNLLLNFYKKHNSLLRKKTNTIQDVSLIASMIIDDIASSVDLTKTQLINLIKQ